MCWECESITESIVAVLQVCGECESINESIVAVIQVCGEYENITESIAAILQICNGNSGCNIGSGGWPCVLTPTP